MFAKNLQWKCLQWNEGRANILCKYIIHTFFQFWACYLRLDYFQNLRLFVTKKIEWFLLHCTSISTNPKSMSQIFKILFQTGGINVFILCGVFFSIYVQLKSRRKKHQRWNLRHHLVEKLSEINVARSWSSAKLFIM